MTDFCQPQQYVLTLYRPLLVANLESLPVDVPFPYGYGQQVWNLKGPETSGLAADTWQIVDQVRAPTQKGDYILRWRWDAEQNPQIWTHCADITVV